MPHSTQALPTITWGDLETAYDQLAMTPQARASVRHLLSRTRLESKRLSPLDLAREIICIGFALTPASEQDLEMPIQPRAARRSSG